MSTEFNSLFFSLSVLFHGNMIMTLCGYGYGYGNMDVAHSCFLSCQQRWLCVYNLFYGDTHFYGHQFKLKQSLRLRFKAMSLFVLCEFRTAWYRFSSF